MRGRGLTCTRVCQAAGDFMGEQFQVGQSEDNAVKRWAGRRIDVDSVCKRHTSGSKINDHTYSILLTEIVVCTTVLSTVNDLFELAP